jgi:hypothetical protein
MLTKDIKKILTNREVEDQPFPEVVPHTHNGVDSPALGANTVDSVNIKPGAVGGNELHDFSVTEQKLADAAVATQKIKDDAITAAKVYKAGSVITVSAQIAEAIILTAHIGTAQITNAKIANASISTAKIQTAAITNAEIADAAITNAKIGALEVGNSRIANAAISTAKIQDAAVTNAEIADATITNAKIGALEVGNSRIANAAISTAKIQGLAVTDAEINDLNAGKVTAGLMLADRIWGGAGYFDYINVRMCGLEAVNVAGNINKTGTCNFSIPHPLKKGHRLVYTGIEAAEVLLVHRGTATLSNGQTRIDFPDHFKAVSDPRNITANLTPRQNCNGLFIVEVTNDHLVVQELQGGTSSAQFDFMIVTVRDKYFDFDFEPEGDIAIKRDDEDEETFKARYLEYRINEIRRKGGPKTQERIDQLQSEFITTVGRKEVTDHVEKIIKA